MSAIEKFTAALAARNVRLEKDPNSQHAMQIVHESGKVLKARWSQEVCDYIKKFHDLDAEEEIMSCLLQQIDEELESV